MDRVAKSLLVCALIGVFGCGGSGGAKPSTCPPGQHDGGNGVCVAVGLCSAGYHDGGGGLCLADLACATGYHDGGDGKCAAAGTCATGYHLATDGTCAKGAACPAGTHDNGAGVCVADTGCPTGYHDDGAGTCVPLGACSTNYHDGGGGDCVLIGLCSAGYHNGGAGTCVPAVACSAGYHDGGDGSCVRNGQCSWGYHDGGDGRCLTLDKCSAGYHDGGDGSCLPASQCAPGFVRDASGVCVAPPSTGTGGATGVVITLDAAGSGGDAGGGAGGAIPTGGIVSGGGAGGAGGTGGGRIDGGPSTGGTGGTTTVIGPAICGNGALTPDEACDDGNTVDGDGCAANCALIEDGWECRVPGRRCTPKCGDGKLIGGEACDDRNVASGDGCSSTCQVEPGYDCATVGQPCVRSVCGNGKKERGELCDCGADPKNLPSGCKAPNGFFFGDGAGCTSMCTPEPTCRDSAGKNQACTSTCGDGNIDVNEDCDDGNQVSGDGCSSACKVEDGFVCTSQTSQPTSTCLSGSGPCFELPMIYRDFQAENVASGGHPDFPFLGTRYNGSTKPTTICVPNAAGPSKGNDSTKRCWGIAGDSLVKGKPQPGATTACACQFSDWSMANSSRIPGNYTIAGNDSPLSDGAGAFQGGTAGTTVNTTSTGGPYTGTLTGYTSSSPGGPIWKGTAPTYKSAASFNQWWNDDQTVNKTFTGFLELPTIGTNIYQYASKVHLAAGGFFPLDVLNPSQATLCNLWPYWNHGNGAPIWSTCAGDQYLFPPHAIASDCAAGDTVEDGCWVTNVSGFRHDSYFTEEAHVYFAYDGSNGLAVSFYGDDDFFLFVNGKLVIDLGGIHQQLPGKVTITGSPGDAHVIEGGCLDAAGNQTGATAGSTACSPTNGIGAPSAASPDDFRDRMVTLGLQTGKVYELAIFGADRHPPESNFQITLQGLTTRRSQCAPRCGDGMVTVGEECDCGDGSGALPAGCAGPNNNATYGGCTTTCRFGPYCGDGVQNGPEECDQGAQNGGVASACDRACRTITP